MIFAENRVFSVTNSKSICYSLKIISGKRDHGQRLSYPLPYAGRMNDQEASRMTGVAKAGVSAREVTAREAVGSGLFAATPQEVLYLSGYQAVRNDELS